MGWLPIVLPYCLWYASAWEVSGPPHRAGELAW
jgi:hypothetical protein